MKNNIHDEIVDESIEKCNSENLESTPKKVPSLGHKSKIIKSNRLDVMKSKINLSIKEEDVIKDQIITNAIKDIKNIYNNNNGEEIMHIDSPNTNTSKNKALKKKNNDSSKFIYGNYSRYYGYRNKVSKVDTRMNLFNDNFFEGKDVLDIGCNIGHITWTIASRYKARKVVGIDIDRNLINIAKKNVIHYTIEEQDGLADPLKFAKNVYFNTSNYVPVSDNVGYFSQDYDIILALSVTKWFHLHHGDVGLQRSFKKMFQQLRPGGCLILEFQEWNSYNKRKKLTETISKNYSLIKFLPNQFIDYLLSPEVGFSKYVDLGVPSNHSKGFQRPVYCFYK